MIEAKPLCGKCLTTHWVEQACKAEDLAKVTLAGHAEMVVKRESVKAIGVRNDLRPMIEARPVRGPGGEILPVEDAARLAQYPANLEAELATAPSRFLLSTPNEEEAKPKFDRAAYMRDRHAKKKEGQ